MNAMSLLSLFAYDERCDDCNLLFPCTTDPGLSVRKSQDKYTIPKVGDDTRMKVTGLWVALIEARA